jgi:4-hydroxy-tetrahydrodipicolinate synthase
MRRTTSTRAADPKSLQGIIPPLVTPLLQDERLDSEAIGRLVEFLIDQGVQGIFVMGTSGEAMSVTNEVWRAAIERTLEVAAGRVPVLCGVIDSCTSRVLERVRAAEDMGAKIVVVTPGFYTQTTCQEEIVRHFEAICRSTRLQVAAYNIPATTHSNILPETIRRLADLENLIAYKDSAGNWEQFQRNLFVLEGSHIALFNGAEELCAASLVFGGDGCVPGLANFFPKLFVDLFTAAHAGDIRKAYDLQKKVWEIRKVLYVGRSWMSAMKYLARRAGFGSDRAAAPVEPLTAREKREIDHVLEQAGV